MAIVECPECKSQVSDAATSCPKCGFRAVRRRTGAIVIAVVLLAIGVLIVSQVDHSYVYHPWLGWNMGVLFGLGLVALGLIELLSGMGKRITPW